MTLSEQLLQKARTYFIKRIDNAKIYNQEFVTFRELMISEGKSEKDFSENAWVLLDQVIQYPFDEFAYINKEDLPENPLEIKDDELFLTFLSCLSEVLAEEDMNYDEINALPLGFRVAFYLLPWDESGGFMMWLSTECYPFEFVKQAAQAYYLIGLKKEHKAVVKALKYADRESEEFDMDKALIAYSYTHGKVGNEVELRLSKINKFILDKRKRLSLFS